MGLVKLFLDSFFRRQEKPSIPAKCPKCKAPVNTTMERCPSCGTHIDAMFRLKCPDCGTANKLDARECEKCKHSFYAPPPERAPGKTMFICPICGYRADFYMTSCPACNTRFV